MIIKYIIVGCNLFFMIEVLVASPHLQNDTLKPCPCYKYQKLAEKEFRQLMKVDEIHKSKREQTLFLRLYSYYSRIAKRIGNHEKSEHKVRRGRVNKKRYRLFEFIKRRDIASCPH